jgi:transposase
MEKLPRTQYSPEFREQAVRTCRESGLPVEEAAKRLSLPKGTLRNWVGDLLPRVECSRWGVLNFV